MNNYVEVSVTMVGNGTEYPYDIRMYFHQSVVDANRVEFALNDGAWVCQQHHRRTSVGPDQGPSG